MMPTTVKFNRALTGHALPSCKPEVAVREYMLSKAAHRQPRKRAEWDIPRMAPEAQLVAAQRQLAAAEEKLAMKRQEQAEKRRELEKQWEDLRKEEESLNQSLITFNKFLKENKEKRERAQRKMEEERKYQDKRRRELEETKKKVDLLTSIQESMEKHIEEYKIYQDYLEKVVAASPEFESIHDVLKRYETLTDARAELAARQKQHFEALENVRKEMIRLTDDKSKAIVDLNNELADLHNRYNNAQTSSLKWEASVIRIKKMAAVKRLELGQVQKACYNLYVEVCKQKGMKPSLNPIDIEHQLVEIKHTMENLKNVINITRARVERTGVSVDSQAGTVWQKPGTRKMHGSKHLV